MTGLDWAIILVMAASVIAGLLQGFFRGICSLLGLIVGLTLAAWHYGAVAAYFLPMVHIPAIANAIGFFLIALLVMAAANIIGALLGRLFQSLGLGCLNVIGGGVLGFFQGAILVTLMILAALAFFPNAAWLQYSRLARPFFGACEVTLNMSPKALAERVRDGLRLLEQESPTWTHPRVGEQ